MSDRTRADGTTGRANADAAGSTGDRGGDAYGDTGSIGEEAAKLLAALHEWAALGTDDTDDTESTDGTDGTDDADGSDDADNGDGTGRTGRTGGTGGSAPFAAGVAAAAAAAHRVNEHLATGGPDCRYCPVCQVISAVRGTPPEVRAHLVSAATSMMHAVSGLLVTPVPDQTTRGDRVEKINLDDDWEDD